MSIVLQEIHLVTVARGSLFPIHSTFLLCLFEFGHSLVSWSEQSFLAPAAFTWSIIKKKNLLSVHCVCPCVYVCAFGGSEDKLPGLVVSVHHVRSRHQIQVVWLCSRHLYLPSHFGSPHLGPFEAQGPVVSVFSLSFLSVCPSDWLANVSSFTFESNLLCSCPAIPSGPGGRTCWHSSVGTRGFLTWILHLLLWVGCCGLMLAGLYLSAGWEWGHLNPH